MREHSASQGTTLVELLISLLVLSVGVFAMLGLQLTSLKAGRSAYYQTQAYYSAQSLAENMLVAADVSEEDFAHWSDQLEAMIPASNSVLCDDATPDDGVPGNPACDGEAASPSVLKVWWSDSPETDGNAGLTWVIKKD